jgi:hypothetical protein
LVELNGLAEGGASQNTRLGHDIVGVHVVTWVRLWPPDRSTPWLKCVGQRTHRRAK